MLIGSACRRANFSPYLQGMTTPDLSFVVPVYQSSATLQALANAVFEQVTSMHCSYELLLIDDGSTDDSWDIIAELSTQYPQVKGIRFSRNFGQHYAITAGCRQAHGDWIIVMDADLQDSPDQIPILLNKAKEGFEVVLAARTQRQDGLINRATSWLFFKLLAYLTGSSFDSSVGNFGIYSRKVIREFNKLQEPVRIFSVMINWLGFPSAKIPVPHQARPLGKSTYNFSKRLHLALDIILAYSDKPLRLMVSAGLGLAVFSFLFGILTLIRYFLGQITVLGYSSLMVTLVFFFGILVAMLGLVGLYIGKIFEAVKNRPLYIITETTYDTYSS